jgi:UDP-N-acetylglucosamine 2-epimerase
MAHLEAGMRSFNRRMPEEHHRVLTDQAADLLLAPTEVTMSQLATEGLAERSHLVGDVTTDLRHLVRDQVAGTRATLPDGVDGTRPYVLATIHRADNTEFLLGVPCTTVRTETEWTETLRDGWNVLAADLVGLDELAVRAAPNSTRSQPHGDGHAADRAAAELTCGLNPARSAWCRMAVRRPERPDGESRTAILITWPPRAPGAVDQPDRTAHRGRPNRWSPTGSSG